jgi:hypothetical protein
MKEVDKKDAPNVSGGYTGPLVTDPPVEGVDYPQNPFVDYAEGDLPSPTPTQR